MVMSKELAGWVVLGRNLRNNFSKDEISRAGSGGWSWI